MARILPSRSPRSEASPASSSQRRTKPLAAIARRAASAAPRSPPRSTTASAPPSRAMPATAGLAETTLTLRPPRSFGKGGRLGRSPPPQSQRLFAAKRPSWARSRSTGWAARIIWESFTKCTKRRASSRSGRWPPMGRPRISPGGVKPSVAPGARRAPSLR
ncbi:MAG: hypothetical protein A3I72_13330 [Candidatus Tectomicrobia bacterium RIFCSPLOWO2_02_FULL_70_19]|nr:MAG: hypothetical protein A3I72_13330 [Candidatus Tectomicrobia bacterium RIFCSPLOWO2_02_FULL_70_19]